MKSLITNGFKTHTANNLVAKAKYILSQMTTNVAVFANPNPSLAALKALIDELEAAIFAAGTRDTVKVGLRDAKQAETVSFLQTVGLYVDMVADGVRTTAQLSGFDVRKVRAPRVLQAPGAPRVARTQTPGSLAAQCGAQQAAKGYLWFVTTDSSQAPNEWKLVEGSSKVTITDCTPGVAYYIRAVVFGYRNQRAESPVVKVVA